MNDLVNNALSKLRLVKTTREFRHWVRFELRPILPHAGFLVTAGKLFGVGSLPTHRIDVDFPLHMVEELKNSAGALDDPMLSGWFRSGRIRYLNIDTFQDSGDSTFWKGVLLSYGFRSMLVHGVMDHSSRRFVVFQVCNPYVDSLAEVCMVLSSLIDEMARVVWMTLAGKTPDHCKALVGHPLLSLTPTELHIVELLAQGLSNKEIARRRGVSDSTVKTQVQRTGSKLGATRRAEIVALALPLLSVLPAQELIDYGDSLSPK